METSIPGQSPDKSARKGNIVLKNLTKEQKEKLMLGQIGLAGIAMGAGAFALMGFVNKSDDAAQQAAAGDGEAAVICTEAPFAESVTDDMTFKEAFEAARGEVGPGGFFEYNGNLYNTYTQDEWQSMSPDMQQQYWTSIDQNTTSITDVEPHQADHITIDTPVQPVIDEPVESEENLTDDIEVAADDIILDVDYLTELDTNDDGYSDVLVVDADGNELPDLIFDDNFDGVADRIVMNVDLQVGITGNEEAYELEGVTVHVARQEDTDDSNRVTGNDTEPDYLSEDELNPDGTIQTANNDAPNFDNEYDVTDYS